MNTETKSIAMVADRAVVTHAPSVNKTDIHAVKIVSTRVQKLFAQAGTGSIGFATVLRSRSTIRSIALNLRAEYFALKRIQLLPVLVNFHCPLRLLAHLDRNTQSNELSHS